MSSRVYQSKVPWTMLKSSAYCRNCSKELPIRNFYEKLVKHLSGGQKQRLNLLRSLVLDTDVLVLDEPLNGLDFASSVKVLSKIEDRLRGGGSVLVISHNEEIFDALTAPEDIYYLHAVA